jgi:glycine/D-amino acid oxidase-like deaminating enzyme
LKFLIIGQGLAGTLTGHRLETAGHTVHYSDAPKQTASSTVAAGIVNPITGRRFVKSWRIDELIPEAKGLYAQLEQTLGHKFWYEQPLIRTLYNRGDLNDWQARSADPGYPEYMDDQPDPGRIPDLTDTVFAYAGVRHAARVDVAGLVQSFREKLVQESRFTRKAFDYSLLVSLLGSESSAGPLNSISEVGGAAAGAKNGLTSKEHYDHIICCEGWRARHNPYFSYLPHGGNKGEVLIVKTKAPVLDRMFKHRVFLVPLADDTYWVGATSENRFNNDSPTLANRTFLEDRLAEILTGTDYEIIGHRAAVRPTVKDRRMFIGQHPEVPRLWILNGLGTKGASLAPLGSRWLVEAILTGKEIPAEVDIRRFIPG